MKRLATTLLTLGALVSATNAWADGKAECIAAFDAGQSARSSGRLMQALTQFAVCARDLCPRSLQKACVDAATESAALLPSVVLSATDVSHADVTDVKVSIDGTIVATVLDGKAMPVDPGPHTFRFERAGVPPVERQVVVKEAQKGQLVAAELTVGKPSPVVEDRGRWPVMRVVGVGAAAVGLGGIVVGSVFGSLAFSKWSTAQNEAKSASTFPAGQSDESTGKTFAAVSTGAFIAGGALVAGGVALYLAAPKPTLVVTPTLGGVSLAGTF
jgi:hypothetical protein